MSPGDGERPLLDQFRHFDTRVSAYDRQIRALAAASEPARRLMQVEAIGPQTATALVASMGDPHVFSSGRCYAASIGITPQQHSSGRIAWAILAHGTDYRPAAPEVAVA